MYKSGKRKPHGHSCCISCCMSAWRRPVLSQCLSVALGTQRAGRAAFHALPTAFNIMRQRRGGLGYTMPAARQGNEQGGRRWCINKYAAGTSWGHTIRRSHGFLKKFAAANSGEGPEWVIRERRSVIYRTSSSYHIPQQQQQQQQKH